jgi:hypothetical protein
MVCYIRILYLLHTYDQQLAVQSCNKYLAPPPPHAPWGYKGFSDRVDRALGFFFSRPNWDRPTPQASVFIPPLVPGGGIHWLGGEDVGGGGPDSDEGQTL